MDNFFVPYSMDRSSSFQPLQKESVMQKIDSGYMEDTVSGECTSRFLNRLPLPGTILEMFDDEGTCVR